MGCGRVGALVANQLDAAGHSVAIIDSDSNAFRRLSSEFEGQRVTGNGFDLGTLKKARIEDAYSFAAVTNGDNTNVIAARTVAEEFNVRHVVARVSDPERAELYERLGIPTIAASRRISNAVLRRLLPPNASFVWGDDTGSVSIVAVRPSEYWYGVPFPEVEDATDGNIIFVARMSDIALAHDYMVVQEEDELFIAIEGTDPAEVRNTLMNAPEADQS